jgi:putative transposase
MAIRDELIEELLKEYKNPKDLVGKDGIIKELTSRLIEKAMEGDKFLKSCRFKLIF